MVAYVEKTLEFLRGAFSRKATYAWFVVAFMGVILRADDYGVTSFVRALGLEPAHYTLLVHFFHSSAWCVSGLMQRWWLWVVQQNLGWQVNERLVFTGDHTKVPKDGRKMPGVATLHQDSETASKPSFFRGHHWGCIALVTHAANRFFSTPLWAAIHEGVDALQASADKQTPKTILTVAMAQQIARHIDRAAYLVLDAYFATGTVLEATRDSSNGIERSIHVITRAKKNIVAYLPALPKRRKTPGRKAIYGEKLKLYDMFEHWAQRFETTTAHVYDHAEPIRYYVMDLLWKPIKGPVRFFWFETSRGRIVLMTTDSTLQLLRLTIFGPNWLRISEPDCA